eukprot:m.59233 g.59233  ORF g.59233 m.59233 type:complete len:321 (-) comp12960_c0_seq1:985-1947(-)
MWSPCVLRASVASLLFNSVQQSTIDKTLDEKKKMSLSGVDNVINLEDAAHCFCGQGQGTCRNKQRLHHVFLQHAGNAPLADVDASAGVTGLVPRPQVRHGGNRVEPRVLRQRKRHNFEGLGVGAQAVCLRARQRLGHFCQPQCQLDLGCSPARNKRPLLDEASNHTERVVNGAVGLLQDELVRATHDNAHRCTRLVHARNLDNLALADSDLLDKVSLCHGFLGKVVDTGNGPAPEALAGKLNVVAFNVLDDHDFHFCEKVKGKVVDGITQNRLLDEQDIATGLFDLLAQVQNVGSLLPQHPVHLSIVTHNNLVLQVGFRG